ncbi:glutathione S-transferase family protein [Phenylobacterium hankyongense]|uniref:Glutathione S-transferase family protein n=1 Tax=Phenylobacterium hankyongense TaxID=1813876 RepID=A0A328AZC3_9CAUL|nr:glutathione S-transferase family protein [Phenylobacterium hankyongense]RAK59645.1 glutathione S-transferase family protein [Phenylobacterium hankyongense]
MSVERTLHHFPLDPASRQVRLVLGEKRLPFTDVQVRYWERPKELTALNPSGLTPVLVETRGEAQLVLCESRAILDHLEESAPEPALLGREPAERAEARRLLQWFDRKFEFEAGGYILHEKMEKRLLGLGAPELANLRQGREGLKNHLFYIDKLLQDREWLAGKRLSLADFAAAAHLSVIDYFGDVPWADFPAVKTWYMKLKSRPCFRPLLLDRWPGLTPAKQYDDLDF